MNKLLRCIGICLGAVFAFGAAACGEGGDPPEKKLQPAPERAWADITTYGEAAAEAYLQPFWYTREIYDESVVMVGETASASLLYLPSGSVTVRDYQLGVTYVEGRDYTVEGKTITRVAGGRLPYFEPDEYFLVSPNVAGVSIGVNASRCEFEFDENRYLYYGEGTSLTKNHVVVSHRTDEMWPGERPAGQTDRTGKLIETLKTEKKGTILYYGDSITVGCNASGTSYGGNVNPYLPSWPELVASWLEKQYGAEIEVVNKAVGGWQVSDGFASYNASVAPDAANTDLLVLAFGMNDAATAPATYRGMIAEMADRYLSANPEGTVLLVSPMNPNTQSTWVGNQSKFEAELEAVAAERDSVAVAPVNTLFTAFETMGKRTRDWLANNINHPNDFGVRAYAQVILKTLAGNDFCEEVYA